MSKPSPLAEMVRRIIDPRVDPVLMVDTVNPERLLFEGALGGPTFAVGEVGKVFFARSAAWVRLQEILGTAAFDGVLPGSRTPSGQRYYTLADLEKMALALAESGAITVPQLGMTLQLLRLEGRLHRLI